MTSTALIVKAKNGHADGTATCAFSMPLYYFISIRNSQRQDFSKLFVVTNQSSFQKTTGVTRLPDQLQFLPHPIHHHSRNQKS